MSNDFKFLFFFDSIDINVNLLFIWNLNFLDPDTKRLFHLILYLKLYKSEKILSFNQYYYTVSFVNIYYHCILNNTLVVYGISNEQ